MVSKPETIFKNELLNESKSGQEPSRNTKHVADDHAARELHRLLHVPWYEYDLPVCQCYKKCKQFDSVYSTEQKPVTLLISLIRK
ncbi:hypothetical protein GCK72_024928 [Caenorhabditis remanei]|uniref:Uncharacterized protein n=1 Tax=Caenorhabditis remanei TaxID=31234 RepID=A0A6A5G129_CAERE|nr:hypothetical protein GCK72_024928 [Caenorhabditis remanei]KAF1748461.1 hypothetical protein GCK72_024928 [Caenorhabditis remanei]